MRSPEAPVARTTGWSWRAAFGYPAEPATSGTAHGHAEPTVAGTLAARDPQCLRNLPQHFPLSREVRRRQRSASGVIMCHRGSSSSSSLSQLHTNERVLGVRVRVRAAHAPPHRDVPPIDGHHGAEVRALRYVVVCPEPCRGGRPPVLAPGWPRERAPSGPGPLGGRALRTDEADGARSAHAGDTVGSRWSGELRLSTAQRAGVSHRGPQARAAPAPTGRALSTHSVDRCAGGRGRARTPRT